MKNLVGGILCAMLFVPLHAFGQDHGRFAICGTVKPFSIADLMSALSSNQYEPSCMLGIRAYIGERAGIDFSGGLLYNSGNKRDSASSTSESPGINSISFSLGLTYAAFQGEKAELGINGKFGLAFQEWNDYFSSVSGPSTYAKYNVTVPSIYFGFEPSYYLSNNVSIFSEFGLKMIFIPNGKQAVGNPLGGYTLREMKDASTSILADGLSIGIRYFF